MEGHPGEIRKELHTSVRNLVEFIFREGDIDNRAGRLASAEAMLEGSRIHRKIQKSMDSAYQVEVPLSLSIEEKDYTLVIEGRADGIAYGEFLSEPDEICYIDEIKGIYRKLSTMEEPVYVHKAQAMCYAYIYALQNHLSRIGLQMTYCNLDTEEIRYFRDILDWDTLTAWFDHLIAEYRKSADWQM